MRDENNSISIKNKPTSKLFTVHIRNFIYPVVLLLTKTRVKYRIHIDNSTSLLPKKPAIFAVNHTNSVDIPVAAKAISKVYQLRCDVLLGKQRLWLSDKLFFFLNGVIWVDRKNKNETAAVKGALIDCLNEKQDIIWFPEGTWNLTDNLLMLPMKWGIAEVAAKAGAQIIPVVLDYDRKAMICHASFGTPIAPDENANKADVIRELRDAMSTLRWDFWENQSPLKRDNIDCTALKEEMLYALKEYPPLDWEYEQKVIFQPYTLPQEVFAHLESITPCRENAFLFNKRYYNVR